MRILTNNQLAIIDYVNTNKSATYKELEPLIDTEDDSVEYATLSCVSGLIQSGILVTMPKASGMHYVLTNYGKQHIGGK